MRREDAKGLLTHDEFDDRRNCRHDCGPRYNSRVKLQKEGSDERNV